MKIWLLAMTVLLVFPRLAWSAQQCDGTFVDASRGNRVVPIRLRLPDGTAPVPVILFSHGLGGSLVAGGRWADAWADAGFAVVNVQHPGSDAALLDERTGADAVQALRKGMTPKQLLARVIDMRFVITMLGKAETIGTCPLARLDLDHIGVAGHSMGAQTVQAIAGQTYPSPAGRRSFADTRVKAVIAFSPAPPLRDDAAMAFRDIHLPFFSITGTDDAVPFLTNVTPADRRRPFEAMPPGDKYLLVLAGADHMVFSGGEQKRSLTPNDRRVQEVVVDASTRFWRRYLLGDKRHGDVAAAAIGAHDQLTTK